MSRDCVCEKCVLACKRMPGLFAPGEAEKAAEFLGLPFDDEFKRTKVIQSHWRDLDDPLIWQPRKVCSDPNMDIAEDEYTNTPGTCVFLKNDRCEIHPVKPYGCRDSLLCEKQVDHWSEINAMYRKAAMSTIEKGK